MTDRLIRDEILTSERYWSVSIEAQRFFIHLLLVADNCARVSGKNYTLRASCFPAQAVQPERIEKLLVELSDADLVRIYQSEGERFLFIPRFRQRFRYMNSKLPAPPNEINDIEFEKSDSSQSAVGLKSDASQQSRVEKRRVEKKKPLAPTLANARSEPLGVGPLIATLSSLKGDIEVRESFADELKAAYPATDPAQEIRRARLWLEANPSRRKSNLRRFLTVWVGRAQERGGGHTSPKKPQPWEGAL